MEARYERAAKRDGKTELAAIGFSRIAFRMVEAAIESIAEGRQNTKTSGWETKKARAHGRAAATIR
jgi:hypothetical protein